MFNGSAKNLRSIFLVGFLLTVALSLTGYLDSSFLGSFINIKTVGLLFSLGSVASIIFLSYLPKLMGRFSISSVFYANSIIYLASILGMLHAGSSFIFGVLFVTYIASGVAIYFAIDLLIEHFSAHNTIGKTRGFYLAIYNFAYLVGPLLAGLILKNNSFEIVYLVAGIFIIIMTLVYVRDLEHIEYRLKPGHATFWQNLVRLSKNNNLFRVYFVNLMLSFFFSWMAIYMPIHLNQFVGFGWDKIGALFALMHIPYVALEIPLGRLADRYHSEKKLMSIGLVIIGISTAAISFIGSNDFWIWALALIATRAGASFIQVSTESYFFKRVTEKDAGLVAIFRNATPVAYILGPLVATLFLSFLSYANLFFALGALMICVILVSLGLKNTR